MNTNRYLLLNRVFSRNTFKYLLEEHTEETYVAAIKQYVDNPQKKNNKKIISEFYQQLKKITEMNIFIKTHY